MLKKRLIGVVTVKNGWAVQSFGYNNYLPLGKPECLVENLDRWGADEILVLAIDRSTNHSGPDFELIQRLASLGLETPLIYGGGVSSVDDGLKVIQLGADRLCIDSILHDNADMITELANKLGVQAVIGAFPLAWDSGRLEWLDYRTKQPGPLEINKLTAQLNAVSEMLIIDWVHEGKVNGFDMRLVRDISIDNIPLIAFGGISESSQMIELLSMPFVSAVAVGNFLSYKENAIQTYKECLSGMPIRQPAYETKFSLLNDE